MTLQEMIARQRELTEKARRIPSVIAFRRLSSSSAVTLTDTGALFSSKYFSTASLTWSTVEPFSIYDSDSIPNRPQISVILLILVRSA